MRGDHCPHEPGAVEGGEVIGSAFVTWWGSFALFGPLTIRPDYWDRSIGRRLMEPVVDLFEEKNIQSDIPLSIRQNDLCLRKFICVSTCSGMPVKNYTPLG